LFFSLLDAFDLVCSGSKGSPGAQFTTIGQGNWIEEDAGTAFVRDSGT